MALPHVGFVGLGTIGRPMARRITRAGFPLTVPDVDRRRCTSSRLLVPTGAPPDELGPAAGVVLIAVLSEAQLFDVLGTPGRRGVLTRARPRTVVAVHSTVHPEAIRRAAASAPDGVVVLDAPVTGNAKAAAEGPFATRVTHLDSTGAGAVANNLAVAVTIRAVREALKVSGAYGGAAGVADLVYKDASLALHLAHDRDLEIPTLAVAAQLMLDAHLVAEDGAARSAARDQVWRPPTSLGDHPSFARTAGSTCSVSTARLRCICSAAPG